jgi:Uma2 family endonuclease
MLRELGYYSYSEVTLRIDPHWEPIPDVIGVLVQPAGEYPTEPVDVVVELLSPKDQFSLVQEKCERYSALSVKDILVLDPVRQKAWFWHSVMQSLLAAHEDCKFESGRTLILENVWSRLDQM